MALAIVSREREQVLLKSYSKSHILSNFFIVPNLLDRKNLNGAHQPMAFFLSSRDSTVSNLIINLQLLKCHSKASTTPVHSCNSSINDDAHIQMRLPGVDRNNPSLIRMQSETTAQSGSNGKSSTSATKKDALK
ncbi:hypothetical protein FCM35_KLT13002 [Carex littledalei]|uniref:Uncharacterized protein n=1 Tax=Carex littledalei TaxID=544730 RepID=A0A833QFZ1_9POAL|nr:hypothetical protein FCM35_KLT13002 [Carex littledalei]